MLTGRFPDSKVTRSYVMAPMALHMDEGRSLSSATLPTGPDGGPEGTVLARTTRGRTVLELHGEIDLAVVLATTPQLYALTASPRPQLIADLRPVTFIDCSGLALLVDVRSRVLAGDGNFTLVCADPRVLRLLRITGLITLLAPVPEMEEDLDGPETESPVTDEPETDRLETDRPETDRPGADGPGTEKGREI